MSDQPFPLLPSFLVWYWIRFLVTRICTRRGDKSYICLLAGCLFFRYPNETAVEEALEEYYADGGNATDGIPPNVRSILEERTQATRAQRTRRGLFT